MEASIACTRRVFPPVSGPTLCVRYSGISRPTGVEGQTLGLDNEQLHIVRGKVGVVH